MRFATAAGTPLTGNCAKLAEFNRRVIAARGLIMQPVTINATQELYVIPSSGGYSCLGFGVCIKQANGIAQWLRSNGRNAPDVPQELRGTIEAYNRHKELLTQGGAYNRATGKRCNAELEPQLIGLEGRRVEVVDRWGEKRRFYVGKSMGWLPCHLEIARCDSTGGGACTGPYKSVTVIRQRRPLAVR